ncbi:uncharacterized protein LOC18424864 isoform X3 [Amborella trichopoda]|uniref:Uncharacterized protein n=1 Tax=Amborella trichopoda TaxID=13333 RepID=W1NMW6_AMBTC|nr:uncharacterized protein LOC18424864 isoform X3 [Amborella trichopoda]ERM96916.1 hypothetical protein AMTR_s00074p00114650 [Amborella trichopoda]|eukprot:XP_020517475.1 uncharacterized protein LOC18424864 isoform X3 [Amborella trichopoda]
MQRLRRSGTAILGSLALPTLRKKASNSWYSVQDTYLSTKDVFERHRVVFTVGSSIASLAVAWAGYSLRYLHQERVEKRLESIEEAMKNNHHVENDEIKKIVNSGNVSLPSCVATAGTALIIGRRKLGEGGFALKVIN